MNEENINHMNEKELASVKDLTVGKLVFLGIVSVALCNFGPLVVFSPVPLILAFLLYGFKKTAIMSGVIFSLLLGVSAGYNAAFFQVAMSFFMTTFFGVTISVLIMKKIAPIRIVTYTGLMVMSFFIVSALIGNMIVEVPLTQSLNEAITSSVTQFREKNIDALKASGTEAKVVIDFLSDPQKIVNLVYEWGFAIIFIFVFLTSWGSTMLVLRNSMLWRSFWHYPHGVKQLVKYKVPFVYIWPLIIALIATVGGMYGYLDQVYQVIGLNVLYCLGVFYFFQGVGIYLDLLTALKIVGFFRSVLVIMTVVMAYQILPFIGLIDNWFDIRKLFKKNKDKEI